MARPVPSSLHDQSTTLRQLKLLVVVLVLSNIGLGIFSFYLLRNVDRTYSDIIDHSVPVLNDLQTLTALTVRAMRGTSPALFPESGENRDEMLEAGRAALVSNAALRGKLLKLEWITGQNPERTQFRTAGEAFTRRANEVLAQLASGQMAAATRLRDERLRPEFDRYISAITKAAEMLKRDSSQKSEALSSKTGSMSKLVLGFASWPVVLLLGLFALTAIFVLVLMVLFRGREMNDLP